MIVYEFVFVGYDGEEKRIDIWAEYETEAWHKADNYAYQMGYMDFYIVG